MNKLTFYIAATLLLLCSNASFADKFKLGVHYQQIEGENFTPGTVEEYFSFYCPHCFKAESIVSNVKQKLPKTTQFIRRHVDGMAKPSYETQRLMSKYLLAARSLGKEEAFVKTTFNSIHKNKSIIATSDDINTAAIASGIDLKLLNQTLNDEKVLRAYQAEKNKLDQLRKKGFSGIPTFLINGKYKVINRNLRSMAEFEELIVYLSEKKS